MEGIHCKICEWSRLLRIETLKMIHHSPAGHPGGSLSVADVIAALYFSELNVKPKEPNFPQRDRFILSKGHACATLYAALGLRGYFDMKEFKLFRRIDGILEGHPSVKIPGIDAPSGSLGMGLSQGIGMAIGAKVSEQSFRTYVVLGDGDMQEGSTWEAIMAAGHHELDNICALLDYNKIQQDGFVTETMDFSPLTSKLEAFKWSVLEIDGHDCIQIKEAFKEARKIKGKPTFIIANTVKGKGVSFMENKPEYHGTVPIDETILSKALEEIEATYLNNEGHP